MSEQTMLALAARYSPWVMLVISVVYIAVNRMWPEWLVARREMRKLKAEAELAEKEKLAAVYERFIEQNTQMIQFIASAAEALHSQDRSLDANTQQIYHLTQAVERGPKCPLPDCPFMNRDSAAPTTAGEGGVESVERGG